MWFNNIIVYQLPTPLAKSLAQCQSDLEEFRLKPCPPHARQSQGWVNPCASYDEKLYNIYGCYVGVAAKDMRLLPTSIIQAVLDEKMKAFELDQLRPMRRNEVAQAKEEIEFELLPKAFTVQKKEWFYIDTTKQWIVINNANFNKAAEILTLLTKSVGGLNACLLNIELNLSVLFSEWLQQTQALPQGLVLGKNCILINDKDDKSQYNCKDIEQHQEEITHLLQQGYTVSSLELVWEERLQFTLTNNFLLKRLKCVDYVDDAFQDNKKLASEQEKFDANFTLFAGEIRNLLTFLLTLDTKKESLAKQSIAADVIVKEQARESVEESAYEKA